MKLLSVILLVIISNSAYSQKQSKIKKGGWISELQLNESDVLPFNLTVKKNNLLSVINAEEEIILNEPIFKNDSFYVKFPYFNSELIFHKDSKKSLNGYWVNYNKGLDYKIPFSSTKKRSMRFSIPKKAKNIASIDGTWQVEFEPNTNSAYPAVGVFKQKNNQVSGTFLTETGDYRFLDGNITSDSLYLSCFDGSHAFLFKAALINDTLNGSFFSGKHWKSAWNGIKNESFKLTSPDELTYIIDDNDVTFNLKDLNNIDYTFPNDQTKDKVVIIQIMGTWCPNCLDETTYYKELYNKYHDQGLEIISICYEAGNSNEHYIKNISRLKEKLNLDFTFLIGGEASKNLASKHFEMLNEVISFPTSIFIGRDGNVKRVHTGFNGPGTGSYYTEYVIKTEALIQTLLSH